MGIRINQPFTNQGIESSIIILTIKCITILALSTDTFQAQVSHKELLTYQGKDAEEKYDEEHHV